MFAAFRISLTGCFLDLEVFEDFFHDLMFEIVNADTRPVVSEIFIFAQ